MIFQNSNSIGLGINLGTVIGGPSSGSSGGTGSPLSGITSGETSPPGIPGASSTKGLLDANGTNGSGLLAMTDLGLGFGGATTSSSGSKSISPENPPIFYCPRRPNIGREGKPIILRANHVQINMPRGYIHHYNIAITPDKCPRKVNRDIIETMVQAYGRIFGTKKPVFDGRSNLYVRDPLPIGSEQVDLEVSLFFKSTGRLNIRNNILDQV